MIRLRFADPEIEHSPEVVAWLKDVEDVLNMTLEQASGVAQCDIDVVPVVPQERRDR